MNNLVNSVNTSAANTKRVVAAASTNATSVKPGPGNVYGWVFYNQAAYDVFVKFYDKASAPTVGTDTPLFTVKVKRGDTTNNGASEVEMLPGIPFTAGIAYAITKLIADSDTTVVVANDITGALFYK
jgi:hypothetical protein